MEAPSIDMLLKVAAPAVKTAPSNTPREEGEQFGKHLRDAAEANSVSSEKQLTEPPAAEKKTAEEPPITTSSGQEQSFTATSDEETLLTEIAEQTEVITEEENSEAITDEAMTDELILSVAAGALVEAEVIVEAPVIVVDAPVFAEVPEVAESVLDPTSAKSEVPAETQPASAQLPAPLHLVDVMENTATESTQENQNAENQVAAQLSSTEVKPVDVSKNSPLTPTVELPKPVAAPKSTKPIVPVATTESEGKEESSETSKSEPVKVDAPAKIVESIAKVVDIPVVTSETNAKEAGTETTNQTSSAPTSAVTNGSQDQSQPIQSNATHTESPAQHADSDSHMPTIDRARFVQRVANAFRSAQQNDGQIQMRLSPPELGSLKIEIAVRNGVLSANLETETADARRVIMDNLPALRQRLAEQDIRIEKFEVDIRREGNPQQGQAEAQQQQTEQQSQHAMARNRIRTSQASEVIAARVPRGVTTNGYSGLDVRV
jgi:flagellar hook-length control protein FliK